MLVLASSRFTRGLCLCLRRTCKPAFRSRANPQHHAISSPLSAPKSTARLEASRVQVPRVFVSVCLCLLCHVRLHHVASRTLDLLDTGHKDRARFARAFAHAVPLHGCVTTVCCASRYIYFPLGGSRRGVRMQLVASFSTFCFIWSWHGGYKSQLWWFIPNWVGIVAETIGGRMLQIPAIKNKEVIRKNISSSVKNSSLHLKRLSFLWWEDKFMTRFQQCGLNAVAWPWIFKA